MKEVELTRLEAELDELLSSIRELEEKANSIRNVLTRIKGDDLAGIDFQAIQRRAKKLLFSSHPLHGLKKPGAAEPYLIGLLLLARYETERPTPLLIFVQWIRDQSGIRKDLEDLLQASYTMDERLFERLKKHLNGELLDMFFLDLLVAASLNGSASADALDLISRLAEQLDMSEENLEVAAVAARCVLRMRAEPADRTKLDKLPRSCTSYLPKYLQRIHLNKPENAIRWLRDSGDDVQKGEKIISAPGRSLIAPCSGRLYRGSYQRETYAVISRADDNRDDIKRWLKQQKGRAT